MPSFALRILPALFAAALLSAPLADGSARADSPLINTDDAGHAVRGYDVVAYFNEGAPRVGSPEFSHDWMGATWLFATPGHRDAFAAEPERYAPQFGGYCAYAIAKGSPAQADPRIWAIVDGKLYLNLAEKVQEKWQANRSALIASAQSNWPGALAAPGKAKAKATAGDR